MVKTIRSKTFQLRITAQEYDRLKQAAAAEDTTVSDYGRELLRKGLLEGELERLGKELDMTEAEKRKVNLALTRAVQEPLKLMELFASRKRKKGRAK